MQIRSFSSLMESYERLIARPNPANDHFYNGLYTRYRYPVLTREHIPPFWMYDADPASNPFMMQRLGVNATMNSGAIKLNGKYCLVVRVEGMDRKSFFAVAESDKPTEGFRFRDYPVVLPDTCAEETNVYDMRLLDLRRILLRKQRPHQQRFVRGGCGGGHRTHEGLAELGAPAEPQDAPFAAAAQCRPPPRICGRAICFLYSPDG